MNDRERQALVAQPAALEFQAPQAVNFSRKTVLAHWLEVRRDRLGDLVDVVAELRPQLRDDPGEERRHLVEIGIVGRIAVDPFEPDTLEKLVHARAHGAVIDQADVRQHMREAGFAGIPFRRHCAGVERSITGHSCPRHGWTGCAWAVSPAGPSSSRR